MKKIILMLAMVMVMAFSAVCSASNGKVLDAEEGIAAKFLNGANYNAVVSVMSDEMKKNWDEKSYANFKEELNKNFGKISTNQLIVLEKHDGADLLLYQVASEKIPAARFVYLFSVQGEKPLLSDFRIMLPQVKKEEAENK